MTAVPTMTATSLTDRIDNLDVLRAVAALAVCFFHFRRGSMFEGSFYQEVASFGHYGVDVFFVISGFVIPLALWKRGFGLSQTGGFWLSRFVRLYPAYLLASGVALLLWYLSAAMPGFRGSLPPPLTLAQVWSNLALTADVFRQDWFLEVAWTLAIEAQYYVLVALVFPVFTGRWPALRVPVLWLWILSPLVMENSYLVFRWTALFGMGLVVMLGQAGMLGRAWMWVLLTVSVAVQWWARDGVSAGVGLGTALVILLVPPLRMPALMWVGGISYSLYLLHLPVGGRVMNYLERFGDVAWVAVLAVPLALAASLLAAFLFYKLVEAPSHAWARKVGRR
jgi:peptidoglycan/LPS O-acetylase OafA/YrhL